MIKEIEIVVSPQDAAEEKRYSKIAADKAGVSVEQLACVRILRKSIDARSSRIKVNMGLTLYIDEQPQLDEIPYGYKDVSGGDPVVVVGSGPAGLFAALRLIELGYRPLLLERGKEVAARKKDIALINRNEPIDPDSNYCFGEGGAGTFSDGKLYTRSKKRGNFRKTLEIFHRHGASEAILYDAHPHIGTDVLPGIIRSIRDEIRHWGGSVFFDTRVAGLIIENNRIKGVVTARGEKIFGVATILATGHSARDVYELLHASSVVLEPKPFAMGVRVEHPQGLIDSIQYKLPQRGDYLPAAAYSLVTQVAGRGVYSFCMCPGGFVVPAATTAAEAVVNGMSPSGRNSPFACAGIVTEIRESDFAHLVPRYGALAGLEFQRQFEQAAYENGGGAQRVPIQRLGDFVAGRKSASLPKLSYIPGGVETNMHQWLPEFVAGSLRRGFEDFGRKMKGFLTNEAVIYGVESRTSSPVRIPRDPDTLEHLSLKGLFPCGEGAGYAGGIVSSAVDGERAADAVALSLR